MSLPVAIDVPIYCSDNYSAEHHLRPREERYQALGVIEGRLHMLVFTPRDDGIRGISLRKANDREVARYDAQAES